jgi:hypothetical protein
MTPLPTKSPIQMAVVSCLFKGGAQSAAQIRNSIHNLHNYSDTNMQSLLRKMLDGFYIDLVDGLYCLSQTAYDAKSGKAKFVGQIAAPRKSDVFGSEMKDYFAAVTCRRTSF